MLSQSSLQREVPMPARRQCWAVLLAVGVLVLTACGGLDAEEAGPGTTVEPDDQAIADGFFAVCNDGHYSENDDFAKTCSSGDGINRWLAPSGQCSDGTVIDMNPSSSCPEGSTFAGLSPGIDAAGDAGEAATATVPPDPVPVPVTTATEAPPAVSDPAIDDARGALGALSVSEPNPARAPYERDSYDGDGWADVDGDCLNTRHELLVSSSLDEPVLDGCRVVSGRWIDPYTGEPIVDADLATIDHVVPLADAHRSGAWQWDDVTKNAFANDDSPGMLVVAAGDSNQSKADKSPDQWLPSNAAAHCQYAIDWIDSKSRYSLTITAAESAALQLALDTCTAASVVRPRSQAPIPNVVITTPTTTTTAPAIVESVGPGVVALLSCEVRAETVSIANTGGSAVSLSGYVLHDEGRKHEVSLGQFGDLQPGQRLTIMSGEEATAGEGRVVWKRQNVWNNDGDIANLIAPDGTTAVARC